MSRTLRVASVAGAIAVASSSCGAPPAPAPVSPAPPVAPPAPTYDLSEIPAASDVIAAARLAHPNETLKTVVNVLGKKMPLVGALTPERIASAAVGDGIGDVLDWTKPLDVAVVADGGGIDVVVSAAAEDFANATKDLGGVFQLAPADAAGVIAIERPASAVHGPLRACALFPAFGAPDHRILCAKSARALAVAGPFLTRTVARWSTSEDAHVEVYPTALWTLSGPTKSLGTDVDRLFAIVGRPSLTDVAKLDLDASVSKTSASLSATVSLARVTSPVWRLGLVASRDAQPLPELFWQLPADSDAAFSWRGAAREDFGSLRDYMLESIRDRMNRDQLEPSAVESALAVVDRLLFTGGPLLFAHGFDAEKARDAVDAAMPQTGAELDAEAYALSRWALVAVEEPPDRWVDGLREAVAINERARRSGDHGARSKSVLVPVAASARLPPGSVHLVNSVPAPTSAYRAGDPPPLPESRHIFVVPDGGRTWLAYGTSERRVLEKLHAILDHAGPTLRDREGLEALREPRAGFAGFVTASFFEGQDAPTMPPRRGDRFTARSILERIHARDDHGVTPIAFAVDGHEQDSGGTLTLRLDALVAAIVALVPAPH